MDMVMSQLGGNTQQIGAQLGANNSQVQSGLQAAVPMLMSALAGNASSPGGAQSLLSALDRDHDGSVLNDLQGLISNPQGGQGAGILGHILGDKQDAVHGAVAQHSGLNGAQVASLMAVVAPVVMGVLGNMKRQQGLDANGLAAQLGDAHQQAAQTHPDLMAMASQLLGHNAQGGVGGLLSSLMGEKS
jgi:hypothetical protein